MGVVTAFINEIAVGGSSYNLLSGESIGDSTVIAPRDVLVLVQA